MSETRGSGRQTSFSGLVGAMLILLLVVIGFVGLRSLGRAQPEVEPEAVDYQTAAQFARDTVDFTVSTPVELPVGWVATSVRFDRQPDELWHIGFLTAQNQYVGLEQSAESAPDMVDALLDEDAEQGPEVEAAGLTWQTWTAPNEDRALVREDDSGTTMLIGTVSTAELTSFVTLLQPL